MLLGLHVTGIIWENSQRDNYVERFEVEDTRDQA